MIQSGAVSDKKPILCYFKMDEMLLISSWETTAQHKNVNPQLVDKIQREGKQFTIHMHNLWFQKWIVFNSHAQHKLDYKKYLIFLHLQFQWTS
jgi:hypothetical protein